MPRYPLRAFFRYRKLCSSKILWEPRVEPTQAELARGGSRPPMVMAASQVLNWSRFLICFLFFFISKKIEEWKS